jgi:hypothetical protein
MIYTIVKKGTGENIDSIFSFDSVKSFDESWAATVTTQTVEYGFDVTDNISIEAPTYSISAMISSYSLFNTDKEIVWDGDDFKAEGTTDRNSHIVARDKIIEMFKSRAILTLIESDVQSTNKTDSEKYKELKTSYFKEIEDCVMVSLGISHPDQGTGAFIVDIKLQKINRAVVTTEQLTEEEMRAALRPLAKTFETQNAKQTSKEGDVNQANGEPEEDTRDFGTEASKDDIRKGLEDQIGLTDKTRELNATVRAASEMAETKRTATVDIANGNVRVIEGTNGALASITKGGVIAVF